MKLDDNKENLFMITDETGKRELHKFNLTDESYVKVTAEKENVKNYWHVDKGLLIATDFNGNEREQLTYFKDNNTIALTNDDNYYHHYGVHMNGEFIYLRNHKNDKGFELLSIKAGGEQKVLTTFDSPTSIVSKFDDENILLTQAVNNIDKEVFLYNIETNELTNTKLPVGRFSNYRSLNDSEGLFTSDYLEGHLNLYKLNKDTFEFKKLTYFKWDIVKLLVLEDKNTVIFEVNKKGFSKLFKYDVQNDLLESLDILSDGVYHSIVHTNNKLYVLYSNMTTPHAVYEYDLAEEKLTKLFGNKSIEIEMKTIHSTYPSFDGLDVPYYLYVQKNSAPTAIHVHGGPESQARPEFNELYHKLYKEGYQIAIPNIRGSTGYSKFYIGLDNKEKRMDAAKDVVELRQRLIDKHQADEKNIFIMGRSYGGFMTLLLITQFPKLWKGAVDIVGISHFTTLLTNTPAWRREQRSYEYGFIGENDEFMQRIAPLNNSQRIRTPLRIFHSHHDVRVPYSESTQMYEKMKSENKDVELIAYENEGHQYLYTENQDDMNERLIDFFNELKVK